jgi:hypothetical protein
MDYKARMYDPALGRFLQPDTIIPGMGNPQSWNRYSYVENQSITHNDPTGHRKSNDDGPPGIPPSWLDFLRRNIRFVAGDVPEMARSLFRQNAEKGTRLLMFDRPHKNMDFYHLNSDLKILESLNHKNMEPLLRTVATIGTAVSQFANSTPALFISRLPMPIFIIPSNWLEQIPGSDITT